MIVMVNSTPSPGTARPSTRPDNGSVTEPTTRKTHTIAATLMIIGTVTKIPAINLRRSHVMQWRSVKLRAPVNRQRSTRESPRPGPRQQPDGRDGGQREAIVSEDRQRMVGDIPQKEP